MNFFQSVWYVAIILAVIIVGVVFFLLDRTKKETKNGTLILVMLLWFIPVLFYVGSIGMGIAPAFWTSNFWKANEGLAEAGPTILKWVAVIAALAIDLAVAVIMANAYEDKTGRNKTLVALACFILPPIGWIYVASVPDYVLRLDVEKLKNEMIEEKKIAPLSK